MATIWNRGTDDRPNFWVGYKDAAGKWKYVKADPASVKNKVAARAFADRVQTRVDAGLPPLDPEVGDAPTRDEMLCGRLFTQWEATLTTRSVADDKSRLRRHLTPKWKDAPIGKVDVAAIMRWIDEQRAGKAPVAEPEKAKDGQPKRGGRLPAGGVISDATIRHNLNLLSRFFSWAVTRGHASINPVRLIPTGMRPHQSPKPTEAPYLDDDAIVRKVLADLPRVASLAFYLCNRCGMRSGEALGLRMGDLAELAEGRIRVSHSYNDRLKEDKGTGPERKVKWTPAPDDAVAVLGPWLAERSAAGAKADDSVFPSTPSRGLKPDVNPSGSTSREPYRALYLTRNWAKVAKAHGLTLTWYEATRHSFASRNLARGASLDEVSDAMGHASTATTKRHYARFIRKDFSPRLREGLGLTGKQDEAPVIDIATARK